MKFTAMCLAALLLSSCASIGRASQYPIYADAKNFSTMFEMLISIHPTENTLLVQPRAHVFSGSLITPPEPSVEIVRDVTADFFGQTGCAVNDIRQMVRPFFEVSFDCPAGFDIRGAMIAQREALRDGGRLRR